MLADRYIPIMAKPRLPRVQRKLDEDSAAHKAQKPLLLPSPEATTNLLVADIILRGASRLFRENVERRVAKEPAQDNEEDTTELVDGKTLIKSLALYGASKLAMRSPVGLGLVAGGLALKTLYDRGKARERRQALEETPEEGA